MTEKTKITADAIKKLRELADKSTRVVSWYAHSQYDGYHLGQAAVRGPFGRWFLVEGGENTPGCLGDGVADLYDDAKYAAAAMNNLPALLDDVELLHVRLAEKDREIKDLKSRLESQASSHGMYITQSVEPMIEKLRAAAGEALDALDGKPPSKD